MGVPRKNFFISALLQSLDLDIPLMPLETPYEWMARKRKFSRGQYRATLRGLKSRGVLEIIKKQKEEFIKLTEKGALRVLLEKARIQKTLHWDGKWRIVIFDIPEDFHLARDRFRRLLKQNHFIKLQASVFISPYPLSRDAINYLQQSGLMGFIRIMKVEEMDNDRDLRKKFEL